MRAIHTRMDLDWSELQTLLSVARAGSFSAAARAGAISQPTLSRRIAALEGRLGVTLFARGAGGAVPTQVAEELLVHAEAMAEAAARLALAAHGREARISGIVRLTASTVMAQFHLPQMLAPVLEAEPGLEVELVASDAVDDLMRREADLAVRMFRPVQGDVIARHIGDMRLGFYASERYLARRGAPARPDDLRDHAVVGYDRSDLIRRGFAAAGYRAPRAMFRLRTDDQACAWAAAVAGCGIGIAQKALGDATLGMRQVLPDAALPTLPVWLVMHEALRGARPVRRVWDALAEGLSGLVQT
jgi:DNA-binding transcriptional LysR family regulator